MKYQIKKKTKLSMLAALLCATLLIVSIFLPYITVEEDFAEIMEAANQDSSLSLMEFAQVYLEQNDNTFLIITAILAGLAVLAALLAVCRLPLGVLLFGILDAAWAVVIYMVFSNAGNGYQLAIASVLIFAACGGMVVSSIWMLIAKCIAKSTARKQTVYNV